MEIRREFANDVIDKFLGAYFDDLEIYPTRVDGLARELSSGSFSTSLGMDELRGYVRSSCPHAHVVNFDNDSFVTSAAYQTALTTILYEVDTFYEYEDSFLTDEMFAEMQDELEENREDILNRLYYDEN
jgi:hypothetical protein